MRNTLLSRRPPAPRAGWLRMLFDRETAARAWGILIAVLVVGAVCLLGDVTVHTVGDGYPAIRGLAEPVAFTDAATYALGRYLSRSADPLAVTMRRCLWVPFVLARLLNGWVVYLLHVPGQRSLLVLSAPVALMLAVVFVVLPLMGLRIIPRMARKVTPAIAMPIILFGLRLS